MEERFRVEGMTCSACQNTVETAVKKQKGIRRAEVSLINKTLIVDYDESVISPAGIAASVARSGYRLDLESREEADGQAEDLKLKAQRRRLGGSLALLLLLFYVSMGEMVGLPLPDFLAGSANFLSFALVQAILIIPIVLLNWHFIANGVRSLLRLKPNMDALVAIGSLAAIIYSLITMGAFLFGTHQDMADNHLFFEAGGAILTFVAIGKHLEERSKHRTSAAIRKLTELAPKTTLVEQDGQVVEIPTKDLAIGNIIHIKPGMAIPVDGVIIDGDSDVDEALVTGEAIPVYKQSGDKVISGTLNQTGFFRFRAEKVGLDTTIAQIVALVEKTTTQKLPIQRFADKLAGVFVPIVIAISLATFAIWMLAGEPIAFALSNAIAVLVISCPCALGLATPVAIMVATGKGAEAGILLKNPEVLERIHKLSVIVFDKTGTITQGRPEVTDVINLGFVDEIDLWAHAGALESASEHPLARAINAKAKAVTELLKATDFRNIPGKGIHAKINGTTYLMGNLRLMTSEGVDTAHQTGVLETLNSEGKTSIMIAANRRLLAIIAVRDAIKPTSHKAIVNLKKRKLRLVMLTGDNHKNAAIVQKHLGIDEVISEVTPAEKSAYIAKLQTQKEVVAMVGDGINDAVALTQADVGIAIGAGSDIAISACDIVLMHSDLNDVARSLFLSEKTMATIKTNLFWAFFYNILAIPVAAGILYPFLGLTLNPMIAALAMSLSSISVVLNALRLKHTYEKETI